MTYTGHDYDGPVSELPPMRPTTKVQAAALLLEDRAELGATWRELAKVEGWGHGSTSRVLSDMHRTGHAARLTERRERCAVYVLPGYVRDRETEPYGRPSQPFDGLAVQATECVEALARQADAVEAVIERWGLDSSRFPSMRGLAGELRGAVHRTRDVDAPTLPI